MKGFHSKGQYVQVSMVLSDKWLYMAVIVLPRTVTFTHLSRPAFELKLWIDKT